MIAKFEETLRFRCPARDLDNDQLARIKFPVASGATSWTLKFSRSMALLDIMDLNGWET